MLSSAVRGRAASRAGIFTTKCYNLDTNKFYYFRFFNNSNSNPASSMDISGSIIIDDTYV